MPELKETDLDRSPFVQFERWFAEARERQPELPEAMTVATCGEDGVVSARVCLLKSFDQHGGDDRDGHDGREDVAASEAVGEHPERNASQTAEKHGNGQSDRDLNGIEMQLLLQNRHHGRDRTEHREADGERASAERELKLVTLG